MWLYSQDETALYDTNSFTVFYILQDQENFKLCGVYNEKDERLVVLGIFSSKENVKYALKDLGNSLSYSNSKDYSVLTDEECSRYQDKD